MTDKVAMAAANADGTKERLGTVQISINVVDK